MGSNPTPSASLYLHLLMSRWEIAVRLVGSPPGWAMSAIGNRGAERNGVDRSKSVAMAKQGNRARPIPRRCQSFERAHVTGRRSSDSSRARGEPRTALRSRIDDCKPKLRLRSPRINCNRRHPWMKTPKRLLSNYRVRNTNDPRSRQVNGGRRALSFDAIQPEAAIVKFDQPLHEREPETGPLVLS